MIENLQWYERMRIRTRFENEAKGSSEMVYVVYTKTVNGIKGALWLAALTLDVLCYCPPNNSRGIYAQK